MNIYLQMLRFSKLCPIHALNFRFSNGLVIFTLHLHRYGQSLQTLRCLYLIAVAPVAPGILHVIVKDKLINSSDQIEIVLPWYVVGLDNGDFLMLFFHNLVKLMKPPPKVKTKNRFKKNIPPRHFKEVDKGRK